MSASLRPIALLLACAGLAAPGAVAATSAKPLSPTALYKALLKIPRSPAALPSGYESPTLGPVAPSTQARRHHVVGEVAIRLAKNGTLGARILYIVFPTRADALADWNEGTPLLPRPRLSPPSFAPKPSVMFNAPRTAKDASNGKQVSFGTTTLAFVTGNVIVEIDTSSTSNAARGDTSGTLALAQFGIAHLATVAAAKPATPPALIA